MRAYFELLRRASALGRGFFAFLAKKEVFTLFVLILGHFCCSVVISIIVSGSLREGFN